MNDFIAIEGIEPVTKALGQLPRDMQDSAVDEINPYLVNVFRQYPSYKYVPFATAYGGWFSDKQRKYVMARIREGSIIPGQSNRTQELARGWKIIGEGADSIIANETPYAGYVMGDQTQARMPAKIGWETMSAKIESRMDQIKRKAQAGVNKAIRKLKL